MSEPMKFCAVVRQPPVGSRESLEMLRFSFGMVLLGDVAQIHVVLEGDGVFNALSGAPLKAMERETARYYVDDCIDFDVLMYAVKEDLDARGLKQEDLVDGVQTIDISRVAELVGGADVVHFL
ncbi:MAG: DsrE family protein [Actinobacteria bacterium]|nr:DsrE family protein [Actinomycetota bacterium]